MAPSKKKAEAKLIVTWRKNCYHIKLSNFSFKQDIYLDHKHITVCNQNWYFIILIYFVLYDSKIMILCSFILYYISILTAQNYARDGDKETISKKLIISLVAETHQKYCIGRIKYCIDLMSKNNKKVLNHEGNNKNNHQC